VGVVDCTELVLVKREKQGKSELVKSGPQPLSRTKLCPADLSGRDTNNLSRSLPLSLLCSRIK
jgi:hypothetical protein